jgi:hypothetical protein
MPQLDWSSHETLLQAGYEYDSIKDKYFNRGAPLWDASEKAEAGRRQGAWPSNSIDEFRKQEKEWIQAQWAKIKTLKSESETKIVDAADP